MNARQITGGGDDAAFSTANNQRLVAQIGIVTLFHRGIEGVAIHMGEREPVKLLVADQPGTAASMAPPRCLRLLQRQAVAAQALFGMVYDRAFGHDQRDGSMNIKGTSPYSIICGINHRL